MDSPSFRNDVAPIFAQYVAQMRWRMDLGSFEDVRENAELIYGQISTKQMPPAPFSPLSDEEIQTFRMWIDAGFPQ